MSIAYGHGTMSPAAVNAGPEAYGMPGDQNHAIDACSTGACSGDVSPYDSGDDGLVVMVGGGGDELNAGEAVDMKLFERWTTSEAGLRVDAGELEQFGRSKSF
jgi:hypothetical protein